MNVQPWKIWIDTGGTFTDCIAQTPPGQTLRLKVLSSGVLRVPLLSGHRNTLRLRLPLTPGPGVLDGYHLRVGTALCSIVSTGNDGTTITIDKSLRLADVRHVDIFTGEEVPVLAARLLTQTALGKPFPALEMKLGSTRGTNALLEMKGARTALLVTKGFRDLLVIGNQQRPDLFSLQVNKPGVLYYCVLEVEERILASGKILRTLSSGHVENIIRSLRRNRIESVAIALLNAYANPVHEQQLGAALIDAGFHYVSQSHQLSSQLKILPRAQTTVVNAYLDPIINKYLRDIRDQLGSANIKVMSSAGGLLDINSFAPKDSLLSGPAGGVVGALEKARLSGSDHIITFDMGGTSTDVARCAGKLDYQFECVVGGQRILSPALAIETIAAGGGSICYFDGYKLCVGPHSAGAQPGPACYGMGGPLTITDVNLLLGRIAPDNFAIPLHAAAAEIAVRKLQAEINAQGMRISRNELLLSFIDIANEKMAEAIRKISVQKGHDPGAYGLLSFGGAGGQHACALASLLGICSVIIPYDAGLLSAFGIGSAREERVLEKLILQPLNQVFHDLDEYFATLIAEAQRALPPDISSTIHVERMIFLRLAGQATSLEIPATDLSKLVGRFKKKYKLVYGHYLPHRAIEVESIRVLVRSGAQATRARITQRKTYTPTKSGQVAITTSAFRKLCPVFVWELLRPGARIQGPALIVSMNSTTFIEDGWSFKLDHHQNAMLTPVATDRRTSRAAAAANLALFTNRFTSVVEDMGSLLQRSSFSVNVKERLDFSCALIDARGNLIVNAPHIPVHLGSLGVCVRAVKRIIPMEQGDVVITNHPAYGGSHLPDITLIKPVFVDGALIGYVVNRAHHAEIGGKKPGSMPADATTLEEEGVIIKPTYLIRKGVGQWREVERLLTSARYPSRSPDENMADLNGGLAALMLGSSALEAMCRAYSSTQVLRYMRAIRSHASRLMRDKITRLKLRYTAKERLDDGSLLCVTITRQQRGLVIDFAGTSPRHAGNLNATVAIVNSVTLYVLRLLVGEAMPLNEGLFEHVKLLIPTGMLRPDFPSTHSGNNKEHATDPAVVGGNTEVSQRLTDTLLKAFGLAACSQGTMNNLLFGNDRFGYYETICGGAGATSTGPGADAVHTHMTNTRITDPEILELKYPVILDEFSIRKGSGGKGKWKGGDGVTRKFVFNDTLEVNLLSQHRIEAPYGLRGGEAAKPGRQFLIRDGEKVPLPGITGFSVVAGDKLIIETPGGGGWGKR